MPQIPKGWTQYNFRAPVEWKQALFTLQENAKAAGELISLEEACRRLFRAGAQAEGVWSETPRPE